MFFFFRFCWFIKWQKKRQIRLHLRQTQQVQQKLSGQRRWSGPPEIIIYDKNGEPLQHIGQSNACLRYVGSLTGLYPDNPIYRALIDEVLDSMENAVEDAVQIAFGIQDETEKKEKGKEFINNNSKFPYWLNKFEQRLKENEEKGFKNGYFVGDNLTICDLKVYSILLRIRDGEPFECLIGTKELISKYKRISNLLEKIAKMDAVKQYQQKFEQNIKDFTENKKNNFIYPGKTIPGSL